MASTHIVESTLETVRSVYLDPAAKPVAVIQPGDTVRYPNTWTHWGNEAKFGMSFAEREPLRHRYPHGPYSMLGPVEVTGAQPGDVIEVSMTALRTIGWGWNSFPLGVGALPHDFAEPYVHYFTFDDARTVAVMSTGSGYRWRRSSAWWRPFGRRGEVSAIVRALAATGAARTGRGQPPVPAGDQPGGRMWTGDGHRCRLMGSSTRPPSRPPPRTWRSATTCTSRSPCAARWVRPTPPGSWWPSRPAWMTRWWPVARGHLLAARRGAHQRAGGLRAGQHGGQLPGHPVRQTDRVGLHFHPPKAVHAVIPKAVFPDDLRARIAAWLRP